MSMTEEMRTIISATAEDAAERAVTKTLVMFGFDTANPLEVQKDMAGIRELRATVNSDDWKKDQQHLRFWRTTWETTKASALPIIIGALTTGAMVTAIPQARAWIFGE